MNNTPSPALENSSSPNVPDGRTGPSCDIYSSPPKDSMSVPSVLNWACIHPDCSGAPALHPLSPERPQYDLKAGHEPPLAAVYKQTSLFPIFFIHKKKVDWQKEIKEGKKVLLKKNTPVQLCSSAVVMKDWRELIWRGKGLFGLHLGVYDLRKPRKEPGSRIEAETVDKCCLLACFPWLTLSPHIQSQPICPRVARAHTGLSPPPSISNQEPPHRRALRPVLGRQCLI